MVILYLMTREENLGSFPFPLLIAGTFFGACCSLFTEHDEPSTVIHLR